MTKQKITRLEEKITEHLRSHELMEQQIKNIEEKFDAFAQRVEPIIEAWTGIGTVGNIIRGLGAVMLALGAIGVGVMWILNHLK